MITRKIGFKDILQGTVKFLSAQRGKSLFSMHIEVTRRCNARCSFCNYWKDNVSPAEELMDYSLIVKKFNPLSLTITGGEPLLRKDLESLIRSIVEHNSFLYINCISNGLLLTPDLALRLWKAGLSQISISLDFTDERHDEMRGIKGLWNRVEQLALELPKTGIDNLAFNTVIMKENLEEIPRLVTFAHQRGWKISFSTYNPHKNQNVSHKLEKSVVKKLQELVTKLIALKRTYGNITSSDFYLRNIPTYVEKGEIKGCKAGKRWFHVSPDGRIRRCSEKEFIGSWEKVSLEHIPPTDCTECWYACRGEMEAPLNMKRIIELNK